MIKWTPARLAKLGLVIFAPVEIARLASGSTFLGEWTLAVTWLGQAMMIGAAVWAALVWTDRPRVIRAALGLLFLMIPVWPWFTVYLWDAGMMSGASLAEGVNPELFLDNVDDALVSVQYLHLIEGPAVTFPSSVHGCVVQQARGAPLAIVSLIDEGTKPAILAAVIGGMAVSVVGAAAAAWSLFMVARTPADRLWVIAAAGVTVVVGGLLAAQTWSAALGAGCIPPDPARSVYRLHLWLGVTLHPFGPFMLVAACVLAWYWPRQIVRHAQRLARLRVSLKQRVD